MNRFFAGALVASVVLLSACQRDLPCNGDVRSDSVQAEFDRVSRAVAGHTDLSSEACLGVLAFRKGAFDEAAAHDRLALALVRSDRDRAKVQQRLASALKYLNRSSEAIDLLKHAISTDAALGDRAAQATASATLASIYSDTGDHQRAIQMSLASVDLLPRRGSVAATYNNVAMDYMFLRQPALAAKYIDMAIGIDRSLDDSHQLGIHEINKGVIFDSAGKYPDAFIWLQRGIEQSRRSGDAFWVMTGEGALGRSLYHLGRPSEAAQAFQQAASLARDLGRHRQEAAFAAIARQIALGPLR